MKARRRRRGKYLGITYSGVNSKEAPQPGGKPFGRAGGGAADIDRDGAAGGDAESRGVANRPHPRQPSPRSEEHTSELQSLMRISYAVFCLKKKQNKNNSKHEL